MFLEWEEAKVKFSLVEVYYDLLVKLLKFYGSFVIGCLDNTELKPTSHEWVGLYRNLKDTMSECVASVGYFKESSMGPIQFNA